MENKNLPLEWHSLITNSLFCLNIITISQVLHRPFFPVSYFKRNNFYIKNKTFHMIKNPLLFTFYKLLTVLQFLQKIINFYGRDFNNRNNFFDYFYHHRHYYCYIFASFSFEQGINSKNCSDYVYSFTNG